MEKSFDRTREFGTVYGDSKYAYEQDGVLYSADFSPVELWSTAEKIALERKQAQTRKAREAALAARREEREKKRRIQEEL